MTRSRSKRTTEAQLVLITGAASGIGLATAEEYGRRGARLVLVDIDAPRLEEAAGRLRAAGAEAYPRVADMGDLRAVDALVREVLSTFGPVDVLVSNAGVAVVAPFTRTEPADWDWVLSVNLLGPLRLVRALLPSMIERGAGHVVLVASLAGLVAAPGMVAYTTSKFAVVGFAEALRLELFGTGVGVTVVCPGFVRTNFAQASRYDNASFQRFLSEPPRWYGMSGERVARELCDAAEAGRPMVVLGLEKLAWWCKRLAPPLSFRLTSWAAQRFGIRVAPAAGARQVG